MTASRSPHTRGPSRAVACLLALCAAVLCATSAPALVSAAAACAASATSDVFPANPAISSLSDGAALQSALDAASTPTAVGGFIRLGCSEKVSVFTQTTPYTGPDATVASSPAKADDGSSWSRTGCPHLRSDLTPFEATFPSVASGDDVSIAAGSALLLKPCSLPAASQTDPTFILHRLTVRTGATLVIDDQALILRVREIVVEDGAFLLAGSDTCRLYSRIQIVFHGTRADSAHPSNPSNAGWPSKGLISYGTTEFHGKAFFPTWTRLAKSTKFNESIIYLQEAVNWEVGQQILITPSVLLDCPDHFAAAWCTPCDAWQNCPPQKHQNEVRTIRALTYSPLQTGPHGSRYAALVLDKPINFVHYAGIEYQAEVALLSRRIEFTGSASTENFGGHIQIAGADAEGRFSGVLANAMGQLNEMGRYPLHFHLMGDTAGSARSYFQDSSVTHSYFRGYVIHGSNSTRLSRNVAFNVTGMTFYLEDGVEEKNLLEYNLAAHVHPIFRPANGGYGQGGETFTSSPDLIVPADTSAAGYYALNAFNVWIGNGASGGWAGFAFPNAPLPIGDFKTMMKADNPFAPLKRTLKRFVGNTAHSNGYHWVEHGSAIYTGAWLTQNATDGVMTYNSGRNSRNTQHPNGTEAIMVFEHSKVWLTNKGIAHWGNTATIFHAEMHDCRYSSMLFGSAAIVDALVVGSTTNLKSNWVINRAKTGFQFYDTWVQTILSGITFRNFTGSQVAIAYLDFSDHYTPQGINTVRGIKYDNVPAANQLRISNCGLDCDVTNPKSSMSSRIYSVWDWDGSMSSTGVPTILGSHEAWWNNSPEQACIFQQNLKVWTCPWHERATVAHMPVGLPGTWSCDATVPGAKCTDQYANYTVGQISQWGAAGLTRGIAMGPWYGVSGYANTGWYYRAKSVGYGIDGAPSLFSVDETMQIGRSNFVVLAVAYPANAQFTVVIKSKWYKDDATGQLAIYPVAKAANLSVVLTPTEILNPQATFTCGAKWYSMCTNTGGVGPTWFFDGKHIYLRVVSPQCYNRNSRVACENAVYREGGISIPDIMQGFSYEVTATCAGCAVQSTVKGITIWSTPDVAPATRFPTAFGAVRATPAAYPSDTLTLASCAAPPVSSSSGANSGGASSTGVSIRSSSSSGVSSSGSSTGRASSSGTSSGASSGGAKSGGSSSSGASSGGARSGVSSSGGSSTGRSSSSSSSSGSGSGAGSSTSSASASGKASSSGASSSGARSGGSSSSGISSSGGTSSRSSSGGSSTGKSSSSVTSSGASSGARSSSSGPSSGGSSSGRSSSSSGISSGSAVSSGATRSSATSSGSASGSSSGVSSGASSGGTKSVSSSSSSGVSSGVGGGGVSGGSSEGGAAEGGDGTNSGTDYSADASRSAAGSAGILAMLALLAWFGAGQ